MEWQWSGNMPLQRYSNGGIIAIPLLWQWSGNGVAMEWQ